MGYETTRRKIFKLFNDAEKNKNNIVIAKINQGRKEDFLDLTVARNTQFNKIISMDSDWIPITDREINLDGVPTYKSVSSSVSLVLPELYIPFVRLNILIKKTTETDIFKDNYLNIYQFVQIKDTGNDLKEAIWNVGVVNQTYAIPLVWTDYVMKLKFSLINPVYTTVS
jgi:hypothetical protein